MKKVIIFMGFLLTTTLLYSNISFVSGFLNDNYTGSLENGINGNYIGADDFLTFTLFAKSKNQRLGISEYYQVVTSRKYGYRYDLLDTNISYDFKISYYNFTPSVSLLIKSNLGGEVVQNEFHNLRDLPELEESYSDDEEAVIFGLKGNYILDSLFFKNDNLLGLLNVSIPTAIKPVNASVGLEYIYNHNLFKIDILGGYKQYFTEVDEYSDFVRSGLIFGGQTVINILDLFTVNIGAFFFPSRNLDNDPYYFSKSHDYSPQFWVTFGLNGEKFSVLDIVNF